MYEYKVLSFDLANASTAFQTYINVALRKYFDVFALAYINDILIFSKILEKHERHVRVVLERLLQYNCTSTLRNQNLVSSKRHFWDLSSFAKTWKWIRAKSKWSLTDQNRNHIKTCKSF
jgi:hypothetical protein